MPTTVHMGKTITQTVAGSDGPLAPGALAVSSLAQGVATVTVDPATNDATIHPVGVGQSTLTYSAPGHQNASDIVTVVAAPPLPTLLVTDGPEV